MWKKAIKLSLIALLVAPCALQAKVIEDVAGNKIEIADNVQRIADLWNANNQIVLLLGGMDKVVATTNYIHDHPWFAEVYPKIKTVTALGNGRDLQTEELLGTQPDVVILPSQNMVDEVNRAGLKGVLAIFKDFDGLKKTVRLTADIIGGDAKNIAEEYIKELEGNIAFIKERTKHLTESEKPVVMHITGNENLTVVDGGKSIIGAWTRQAGGRSAFPELDSAVEVGLEEVIKVNPDVITVGGPNAARAVTEIKQSPRWQSISAVKNNRIFVNPMGTFLWDRYSAEEPLQVLWAARVFHPDLFKDLDMVEKTQAFYKKYYNYDLSKENAQQILQGLPPLK